MCRTLTLSTEPLPKTANEDKDSALHTGQFSTSVSQSHMQTVASPGKRACCFPPGWETASHSRPQPSSEAWRSKACETGTSVCVHVCVHVSLYLCLCMCLCASVCAHMMCLCIRTGTAPELYMHTGTWIILSGSSFSIISIYHMESGALQLGNACKLCLLALLKKINHTLWSYWITSLASLSDLVSDMLCQGYPPVSAISPAPFILLGEEGTFYRSEAD